MISYYKTIPVFKRFLLSVDIPSEFVGVNCCWFCNNGKSILNEDGDHRKENFTLPWLFWWNKVLSILWTKSNDLWWLITSYLSIWIFKTWVMSIIDRKLHGETNKPCKRNTFCAGVVVSINDCWFWSMKFIRIRLNNYSERKLYLVIVVDFEWFESLNNGKKRCEFDEKKIWLCHDCVCGTKFWVFKRLKPIVCGDWLPVVWVFGRVCHDWSCPWVFEFWKSKQFLDYREEEFKRETTL